MSFKVGDRVFIIGQPDKLGTVIELNVDHSFLIEKII